MQKFCLLLVLFHFNLFAQSGLTKPIVDYCKRVNTEFKQYKWEKIDCDVYNWHHVRNSVKGTPLTWVHFGEENLKITSGPNITMIMCGIHGDEITPIKFCFDIMNEIQQNKDQYKDKLIIIAPIVNPDSFFTKRKTRVNANGIDVNRNFPTKDWPRNAIKYWKQKYRSDIRRYPGKKPLTEPEVIFQVNLIKLYNPKKIISVHSPLTLLDYDGPGDLKENKAENSTAHELLIQMSQKAEGYKVQKFPFYPGSLGNWAGQERQIPTYTLELPSSDFSKADEYWTLFKKSITHAILHDVHLDGEVLEEKK